MSNGTFDPNFYVKKNLDSQTVTKFKEIFDVFDYDHSGNVSTEELINTIRALNMESQVAEILAVISGSGHTGNIDFTAFLEIFSVNGDGNLENCFTSIFQTFDYAGTGSFGPSDFQRVAASVGSDISQAEINQIFLYADRDRDGVINFEEFLNVVTRTYTKA